MERSAQHGGHDVAGQSTQDARDGRAPKFVQLVESETGASLHEKLYQRVRELILSGKLSHGARLAPSRSLAASLGVSRNSVLTAIDRLIADGFLESRK
ncbi:MAG TPA: winged helix-turn-helix domain-containing protein, partial [Rhizomicrobium sp.]